MTTPTTKDVERKEIEKSHFQLTDPKLHVASGLQQESKISLYVIGYNNLPQASVFVYPARLKITPGSLPSIDALFSEGGKLITEREFEDASVETLDRKFLQEVHPLISFMDYDFISYGLPVKEHSYVSKSKCYLEKVINYLELR
ncbi:MAG: hypothetical protein AABW65_03335 [Nanoarchaeota archaeon]